MNVRHLAELAGLLSVHALQIVESPTRGSVENLHHLKEVCRKRSEAWALRMQRLCAGAHGWASLYAENPCSPLIEEILVSEVLSRVVAGLFTAQGQQQGEKIVCRLAADVFNDHQVARRMALMQMIEMADVHDPAVRKLDRLRRLAERWTDILLGPLACRYAIQDLTFVPARSQDYGQAILPHLISPAGSGLFAAGLRVAFPESVQGVPSHAGFHRDIAAAVLALLPWDLFEQEGGLLPLRSVRSLRSKRTKDTMPAPSPGSRKPCLQTPAKTPPPAKISFRELRRRRQKP